MILTLDDAQEYIEKLEAENAKLRQQVLQLDQEVKDTFVAMVRHHEEEIKHEVEPLRQQVEDMKCCGNCKERYLNHCEQPDGQPYNEDMCCEVWQSDNLTKEDRE